MYLISDRLDLTLFCVIDGNLILRYLNLSNTRDVKIPSLTLGLLHTSLVWAASSSQRHFALHKKIWNILWRTGNIKKSLKIMRVGKARWPWDNTTLTVDMNFQGFIVLGGVDHCFLLLTFCIKHKSRHSTANYGLEDRRSTQGLRTMVPHIISFSHHRK